MAIFGLICLLVDAFVQQVHFLHEEDIVDSISQAIEKRLKGSNESRSFSVQPITAMLGIPSATSGDASAKQRRRESVMEEEEKKEEVESSDEEMEKRESDEEDEADRSADSIELDLSQKPTPPSKKYQPALVSLPFSRFLRRISHSVSCCVWCRHRSAWCEPTIAPTR